MFIKCTMRFLHFKSILGTALATFVVQGCTSYTSTPTGSLFSGKQDACSYIEGKQYPYDWKDSNIGACVIKLTARLVTTMAPDPFLGTTLIPQTRTIDNEVYIKTPIGEGAGAFEGNYINGTIRTTQGDIQFICLGTEVTNSSRGLCGI